MGRTDWPKTRGSRPTNAPSLQKMSIEIVWFRFQSQIKILWNYKGTTIMSVQIFHKTTQNPPDQPTLIATWSQPQTTWPHTSQSKGFLRLEVRTAAKGARRSSSKTFSRTPKHRLICICIRIFLWKRIRHPHLSFWIRVLIVIRIPREFWRIQHNLPTSTQHEMLIFKKTACWRRICLRKWRQRVVQSPAASDKV